MCSSLACSGSILVVDDEPLIVRGLTRMLSQVQLTAVGFEDPVRALDAAREEAPLMVITDLRMPHMNGLELITELRRLSPGLPAILHTGTPPSVCPPDVRLLAKPATAGRLIAEVRELLEGHR